MGRAFVLQLAQAGADVAFCDLSTDAIEAVEAEAADLPGLVKGFVANVAKEDDVVGLIPNAAEALGGLNGLINNAGIFRDGLLVQRDRATGDIKQMSLAQWPSVIDVDLTGPFLCTREFAAHVMDAGGPAVVVNISSIARHGNRGQSTYSAAKAGLIADPRLWALELARYGIRVGAVAPGFVRTPILDGMKETMLKRLTSAVPLARVGETQELWLAVKFIFECDYFTGRCVDVDGGLSL